MSLSQCHWYCTVFPIHLEKRWVVNIKYGPSLKWTIKSWFSRWNVSLWFVLWHEINWVVFNHNIKKGWASLCFERRCESSVLSGGQIHWLTCWKGFCRSLAKTNKERDLKLSKREAWYTYRMKGTWKLKRLSWHLTSQNLHFSQSV